MKYFAKNTRFLRKLKGLKLGQMEDAIGIKASTWNNYESAKSYPNLFGFVKVAQFFKVDEYTLLHVDITEDARLIEMIKQAHEAEKKVYMPGTSRNSEVQEPAQSFKHPALVTEIFQRVIDLEADVRLLKEQLLNA